MTGQNDRQTQILSGQMVVPAGHCPVTGRYLSPAMYQTEYACVKNTLRALKSRISIKQLHYEREISITHRNRNFII